MGRRKGWRMAKLKQYGNRGWNVTPPSNNNNNDNNDDDDNIDDDNNENYNRDIHRHPDNQSHNSIAFSNIYIYYMRYFVKFIMGHFYGYYGYNSKRFLATLFGIIQVIIMYIMVLVEESPFILYVKVM